MKWVSANNFDSLRETFHRCLLTLHPCIDLVFLFLPYTFKKILERSNFTHLALVQTRQQIFYHITPILSKNLVKSKSASLPQSFYYIVLVHVARTTKDFS